MKTIMQLNKLFVTFFLIGVILLVSIAFSAVVPKKSVIQINSNDGCCSRCDDLWAKQQLDYQGWYNCKKNCGCIGFN